MSNIHVLRPKHRRNTIIDNRPKSEHDSQRMANYETLFHWTHSALKEYNHGHSNPMAADFVATYINNKLPDGLRLAKTKTEQEFIDEVLNKQRNPWPVLITAAAFIAVVVMLFLLIPGN